MIRKYIWPYLSPLINNKRAEPLLIALGVVLLLYGAGYTILGVFLPS